jgi:hypothetical protein
MIEDGKWLCNKATEPAILNQMKHTQDIQFPDGMEMYQEIKPGPQSKHGLSKWISSNPEPALESWHGHFANFGNAGMAAGLSDCLHLKGRAEGNVKICHILVIQEDEMINEWLPSHHCKTPALKDHLSGSFIIKLALKVGCGKIPFPKAWPLQPPNGEKFLSEYCTSMLRRHAVRVKKISRIGRQNDAVVSSASKILHHSCQLWKTMSFLMAYQCLKK